MRLLALVVLALAGCISAPPLANPFAPAATPDAAVPGAAAAAATGPGDAVVVAVVDLDFSPYHLEWRSGAMPQNLSADPADDLPLDRPPHEWLPGFPDPSAFASYAPLGLTLPTDPTASTADLVTADAAAWDGFERSARDAVSYRWVPGTKIVGLLDFAGNLLVSSDEHGSRTSSIAAGTAFGMCPECLLVFVQADSEEAGLQWALAQPWIDVVTNSWAMTPEPVPLTGVGLVDDLTLPTRRTFAYGGCDLDLQRAASERGQTIFWSGGNGVAPGFLPGSTLVSCQMGPDWMITVGGTAPSGGGQPSGKPVDVSAISEDVPAQSGETIGDGGASMGGTSASTPLVAGLYARALWEARAAMAGPSRAQADGVVAVGAAACGEARADCEVGDGVLTAKELRTRLLHGAAPTPQGMKPLGFLPPGPAIGEEDLLSEGHGTYWGRSRADEEWRNESERIAGPLLGRVAAPERPAGEAAWFAVDSWCRQHIWGEWKDGAWSPGGAPPAAEAAGPLRAAYGAACPVFAAARPTG